MKPAPRCPPPSSWVGYPRPIGRSPGEWGSEGGRKTFHPMALPVTSRNFSQPWGSRDKHHHWHFYTRLFKSVRQNPGSCDMVQCHPPVEPSLRAPHHHGMEIQKAGQPPLRPILGASNSLGASPLPRDFLSLPRATELSTFIVHIYWVISMIIFFNNPPYSFIGLVSRFLETIVRPVI